MILYFNLKYTCYVGANHIQCHLILVGGGTVRRAEERRLNANQVLSELMMHVGRSTVILYSPVIQV